jgi:hypothetical protein
MPLAVTAIDIATAQANCRHDMFCPFFAHGPGRPGRQFGSNPERNVYILCD